jgi:hypothetical protein
MRFDPESWLGVAEVCCITIPGIDREAMFRTAVNRAYYAALIALKQRIEDVQGRGVVPPTGTHEALTQAVRVGGDQFEEISRELGRLRRAREGADYVTEGEPLQWSIVRDHLTRSRTLIRNLIKALPEAEFRRLRVARR